MRKQFNFGGFMFNMIIAFIVMVTFNVAALPAIGGSLAVGAARSFIKMPDFSFQAGVSKEIWTDVIMEGFYPKDDFLAWSRDMTELVEFNTINLAEAGVDPNLLIDNTVYPISASVRTDVPKTVLLRTLDTDSSIVRNLEKKESSFDKMDSVVRGHRNTLRKGAIQLAAHFWAPQSNTAFTPVLAASGELKNGRRVLLFEDVLLILAQMELLDVDPASLAIMLNPGHKADLMAQDMKLYKEMLASGSIFSTKYFVNSQTPRWNATTGAKVAFQAAAAGTDTIASTLWCKDEVMKADGTVEMFAKYNDPDQKGDVFNFQKRFIALPMRNKILGAIYSPKA